VNGQKSKLRAALGSAVFFVVAPCVVAGVLPWLISGWTLCAPESWLEILRIAVGGALVLAGLVVLVRAFIRFVDEGTGTPAPVAPTERLVVGGDYRYVRNPMYVAVVTIVVGQSVMLGSAPVLLYAAVSWLVMASFVRWHEEPALRRRFGSDYDSYTRSVRAWWPRLRPWRATGTTSDP
jgi:protein-S-isoprenylcysteine O-methyltransferase Ste14